MSASLLIIDVETTGFAPASDRVVELAWCDANGLDRGTTLVDPQRDVPAEASAVHHLTAEDLLGAPTLSAALGKLPSADWYVAHNSRFESAFLPWAEPWICTYRAALRAWPEAPAHKNQVLRYWLNLDRVGEGLSIPGELHPHRALYDCLTTAGILRCLLRVFTIEELADISQQPALLPRVTFGKHGPQNGRPGTPWSEVPKDYLRWILGQDFDEDVRFTAQHYLEQG